MSMLQGWTDKQIAAVNQELAGIKDEWKECRQTIDRFDKLLVDLRKTGFGFITAIVSGATIFFSQGLSGEALSILSQSPAVVSSPELLKDIAKAAASLPESAKFAIFTIILVLTWMLYLIDLSHQRMLHATTDRAKVLEEKLGYAITNNISVKYKQLHADFLGLLLYYVLVIASYFAFFLSIGVLGAPRLEDPYQLAMAIEGLLALLAMLILSKCG